MCPGFTQCRTEGYASHRTFNNFGFTTYYSIQLKIAHVRRQQHTAMGNNTPPRIDDIGRLNQANDNPFPTSEVDSSPAKRLLPRHATVADPQRTRNDHGHATHWFEAAGYDGTSDHQRFSS